MDLYTLNDQFLANTVVDEFTSAIWTERYSTEGDVKLVVPATQDNLEKLKPGTLLALRGSKTLMELQTQEVEKKLVTITGIDLITFLNNRLAWFMNPPGGDDDSQGLILDYTDDTKTPGEFISYVVEQMVINPTPYTSGFVTANLEWDYEEIDHLTLGPIDTSGDDTRLTARTGPLYDAIRPIAEEQGIGISLYLESADPTSGYSLKFKTFRGKDRTSGQSTNPLVRLTPSLDSLNEIKEIRSNAIYKNVAYVWYDNEISIHYAEPELPIPEGFARRVLVADAQGEIKPTGVVTRSEGYGTRYSSAYITPEDIVAWRAQNARNAFANNNYVHAIDGQTSPISEYKYGIDYELGDIIELQGLTGALSKARITEYIRSEDQYGEKEYPTVSVINSA